MTILLRELELAQRILDFRGSHVPGIENDIAEIFDSFFNSSPDCMFHVLVGEDGSFRYEAVNPAGLRGAGLTIEQMKGRTPEDVLGPEKGLQMTKGLREACRTGRIFRYEPTWKFATGTVVYDAGYMPLIDSSGAVTSLFGIARNITEQRRLEAMNSQSSKMDALGKLASGVAHDFNNLLAAQQACFTLLERHPLNDTMKMLLAEGLRSVQRGKALTDQLVAFARQKPLTVQRINFNDAVRQIMPLIERTVGLKIPINLQLEDGLYDCYADLSQIETALLNLAINARDAMPKDGKLTITTRNIALDRAHRDLDPGEYVAIEVTDNGTGIPGDIIDNILEPFFTTKEPGEGTGLGLSLVYGTARQFGGDVRIESVVGVGTTVSVYLPRTPDADQIH